MHHLNHLASPFLRLRLHHPPCQQVQAGGQRARTRGTDGRAPQPARQAHLKEAPFRSSRALPAWPTRPAASRRKQAVRPALCCALSNRPPAPRTHGPVRAGAAPGGGGLPLPGFQDPSIVGGLVTRAALPALAVYNLRSGPTRARCAGVVHHGILLAVPHVGGLGDRAGRPGRRPGGARARSRRRHSNQEPPGAAPPTHCARARQGFNNAQGNDNGYLHIRYMHANYPVRRAARRAPARAQGVHDAARARARRTSAPATCCALTGSRSSCCSSRCASSPPRSSPASWSRRALCILASHRAAATRAGCCRVHAGSRRARAPHAQARVAVVAFLAVSLTLVILSADRMHNLTCAPRRPRPTLRPAAGSRCSGGWGVYRPLACQAAADTLAALERGWSLLCARAMLR